MLFYMIGVLSHCIFSILKKFQFCSFEGYDIFLRYFKFKVYVVFDTCTLTHVQLHFVHILETVKGK
jgi:hypothetical protein